MSLRRTLPLIVLVAACSGTATTTTSTTAPPDTTTTAPPATTTTSAAPTTTVTTVPGELILPSATETMPDGWTELFFIPYGETPDTLGTSLGGDGEGVYWGPEYGAQAPDGSWWFLDVANFRLAHFGPTGDYIDEVVVPTDMLVQGIYFQWTQPRALDDSTVLAARLALGETGFLRYRDGVLDEFVLPVEALPRLDDGTTVYAMSFDDSSTLLAVDPVGEASSPTDWMTTRDGSRFAATVTPGVLTVELPDAGATQVFEFESDGVGGPAHLSIEVATDYEGGLHFFILGFPAADETQQLAAYMKLSPDGAMTALEPMMNPNSTSDPGTPARLGVTPGTTSPTFMHIGTDGVRVYTKDG